MELFCNFQFSTVLVSLITARAPSQRVSMPLSLPPLMRTRAHTPGVGLATLGAVQEWYRRESRNTASHACVLFAERALLESYLNTFQPLPGVERFELVPSNAKAKLTSTEVVEWRNKINEHERYAQCNNRASSVDFCDLFITLVHYGVDEAATKHELFGHKGNEQILSRKFTSLHIFAKDPGQQELIYEKLSKVTKWHNVFTSFLPCGLQKESPQRMFRSRRSVARPSDPDFHKRRGEFNLQRARAIQLGQNADDLFLVNNMALTRRCIGQQVWEQYRTWYSRAAKADRAAPFAHADTFESFRSECEASQLLSSSGENPHGDRSVAPEPLTVGGAVAEMRKKETVDHWLGHLYRLEVDFSTEKMGYCSPNHKDVCAAVLRRVTGKGGAAETSHALFSLAVGTTMPLTDEVVANACSGIYILRKVYYEGMTEGLFKSPHSEAHEAMPMEVDGNSGADVRKKRRDR